MCSFLRTFTNFTNLFVCQYFNFVRVCSIIKPAHILHSATYLILSVFHISAHILHSAILGIMSVCNTNMFREGDARACVAKVL